MRVAGAVLAGLLDLRMGSPASFRPAPGRLLALVACATLLTTDATAQVRPLRIDPVQGITFGIMLPGVASPVLPTDAARAALLDVTGPNRDNVQIHFTLPAVLHGPAGATAPISFSNLDAGWSPTQSAAGMVRFDPHQPFTAALSNQGRGTIYLGGTLSTLHNQRAGAYSATVTVTVIHLGI